MERRCSSLGSSVLTVTGTCYVVYMRRARRACAGAAVADCDGSILTLEFISFFDLYFSSALQMGRDSLGRDETEILACLRPDALISGAM